MPTKPRSDRPRRQERHPEVDPEHDFTYGGDMEQDDTDVTRDGGQKGGREHREAPKER